MRRNGLIRTMVIFVAMVLFVGMAVLGCTVNRSPTPEVTAQHDITPEPTLTPTSAAEIGSTTETPESQVTPSTPPNATVEATPETQLPEGEGNANLSPAYDIYIGMDKTGAPCAWDTNAGGFSRLSLDSAFHHVRFVPPWAKPEGWGDEIPFDGDIAEGEDESIGEVADYAFCPTYEGDEVYQCFITEGPNPFEVKLSIESPDADTLPLVPLVPTPDPLDSGPELYLVYTVWDVIEGETILRAGDGHLGDCDGIGGPFGLPQPQIFPVPWNRVMKGEEFVKEFGYLYEDGSQDNWTVRFIPIEAE